MPRPLHLPDPREAARAEAHAINADRKHRLDAPIDRMLADAPQVRRDELLAGITAFHQERMERIPSHEQYPEARPWVEHAIAVDRELVRQADLTPTELAIYRSLGPYVAFRGFEAVQPAGPEKCRVAYDPQCDHGELHIKNVDDPSTFWEPGPPMKAGSWTDPPSHFIVWDGVGSGLHMDDEPPEIFPLPVPRMYAHYCDDVPQAVEFLTRYCYFWGGQNIVLHDAKHQSVAIEKCSFNHIEVFKPDASGRSWCSGMATRDPDSPQGAYQRRKRAEYLHRFGLPEDGPDQTFWNVCDGGERKLAGLMKTPGVLKLDDVFKLFTTPYPEGLNKTGAKWHPDQGVAEYTLVTFASVSTSTKRTSYRWQRGPKPDLTYPTEPQIVVVEKPAA